MGNYWNERAKKYGHTGWRNPIIYLYDQEVRLKVIQQMVDWHITEYETMLDYGGGSGDFSLLLLSQFNKILFYDISETVVDIAKKRIISEKCIFVGDKDALMNTTEKMDLILAITVFQHIKDDEELRRDLANLKNKLSKNGRMIILEDTFVNKEYESEYIKYRKIESFEQLLSDVGLKVEKSYGFYQPVTNPVLEYDLYKAHLLCRISEYLLYYGFERIVSRMLQLCRIHKRYITTVDKYIFEPRKEDSSRIYICS